MAPASPACESSGREASAPGADSRATSDATGTARYMVGPRFRMHAQFAGRVTTPPPRRHHRARARKAGLAGQRPERAGLMIPKVRLAALEQRLDALTGDAFDAII